MNRKIKTIVKKSAKIGAVVCVAAGAVAVMTSKTALQVILEGSKYFKDTVKKIINEEPKAEPVAEAAEAAPEDLASEETVTEPVEETVAEEEFV